MCTVAQNQGIEVASQSSGNVACVRYLGIKVTD
jgi:hypothetical protein